jgi:nucleolar protein 9
MFLRRSVASDKRCSSILESLLVKATPAQLRVFFHAFAGYNLFLWTNRYSSHVLETMLRIAGPIIQTEVEQEASGADLTAEDGTPALHVVLEAMCKELGEQVKWIPILQDISGTHVLRSLVCVLTGHEVIADKRGKKAKHKQHQDSPTELSDIRYEVPTSFTDTTATLLSELLQSSPDTMRTLACDRHGGGTLQMILRVHAGSTAVVHSVLNRTLEWNDVSASQQAFYNLSGEPVGSHFIEVAIRFCNDQFFEQIYERALKGKLMEYALDPVSNFIVQVGGWLGG